jgi:hypothetical protein
MQNHLSFKGYSIVSCGTLRGELNSLRDSGFLDVERILFTAPGLHEKQRELEKQLLRQLNNAKKYSQKVIVVYGERCYLDPNNPYRDIDRLIQEAGFGISRVKARSCVDILASEDERESIRGERKIYWLTSGWVRYWKTIFDNWDIGQSNETFPGYDAGIVLDAFGEYNKLCEKMPEVILEFSDWMKLQIEPYEVTQDRLKNLLLEQIGL